MFPFEIVKHNFASSNTRKLLSFLTQNSIQSSFDNIFKKKRREELRLINRKFEKRPQFHKFHKLQLVPLTLSRKRSVPKGSTRTLLLTYSKRVFKSLQVRQHSARCARSTFQAVRSQNLSLPRANVFSNLPLSSTQFPFVRAHDEFSLEISSDCFSFFFFPFSFLPSFLPLPLSPLCPSSSVVVFPRDGSKMEAFVGARIKETRLFFFFFFQRFTRSPDSVN